MNAEHDFPSPAELSPAEQVIYQMIYEAAEIGAVCPVNIDLEVAAGFNSTSMGPKTVARLEAKGLIRVKRFQKFREVEIVATGKSTARSKQMHVAGAHVPRGARQVGKTCVVEQGGTYRVGRE